MNNCTHRDPVIVRPRATKLGAPVALCRCGHFNRLRGGDWEPSTPDVVPLRFPWPASPNVAEGVPYPDGAAFDVVVEPWELAAAWVRLIGGRSFSLGGDRGYVAHIGPLDAILDAWGIGLWYSMGSTGQSEGEFDWTAALPATLDDFERLVARVLHPRGWVET